MSVRIVRPAPDTKTSSKTFSFVLLTERRDDLTHQNEGHRSLVRSATFHAWIECKICYNIRSSEANRVKTTKLHYLRRHSLLIIGVLFASLVEDACAAFYPLAMSYVIDDYSSLTPDKLGLTAGLFAVASLVLLIADYLTKLGMVRLARDVKSEIRRALFASLLTEGGADFANHAPAYYVSLLSNDVDELYYSYYDNVVWFIRRHAGESARCRTIRNLRRLELTSYPLTLL